jgi:hypothetical protein
MRTAPQPEELARWREFDIRLLAAGLGRACQIQNCTSLYLPALLSILTFARSAERDVNVTIGPASLLIQDVNSSFFDRLNISLTMFAQKGFTSIR